jgi:hypothetical protein
MIQRIQTLYLTACSILLFILGYLFKDLEINNIPVIYPCIFCISLILTLYSIFSFKDRKRQFILNRLNIISSFILLLSFAFDYLYLDSSDIYYLFLKELSYFQIIPIFNIALLVFSNKAIKKDEDLISSLDRIR